MIFERTLKAGIAVATASAAAAVTVAAASFALYALLQPSLGRPGAAAIVAVVFALVAVIVALISFRSAKKPKADEPEEQSLPERLIEIARSRPVIAAGAVIAATVVALRNPALVGLLTAMMAGKKHRKSRR